jgi:hypothetical protein
VTDETDFFDWQGVRVMHGGAVDDERNAGRPKKTRSDSAWLGIGIRWKKRYHTPTGPWTKNMPVGELGCEGANGNWISSGGSRNLRWISSDTF